MAAKDLRKAEHASQERRVFEDDREGMIGSRYSAFMHKQWCCMQHERKTERDSTNFKGHGEMEFFPTKPASLALPGSSFHEATPLRQA